MYCTLLIKSLLSGLIFTITTAFPCKSEDMNKKTVEQIATPESLHDRTKAQKNITHIKAEAAAHTPHASSTTFTTIISELKDDFARDTTMLKSFVEKTATLPAKLALRKEKLKRLDEETGKKFEDFMKDKSAHKASLALKEEKVTQLLATITDLSNKIAIVDKAIVLQTTNIKDLNSLDEQTTEALISDIDNLIITHQSLKAVHDQTVAEVNDIIQQFPQDNENIKTLLEAIREQVCVCKEDKF